MTRLPTGASRWQQLKRMLEHAIELPPAEQQSYLDQACGGDPFLRRELESLVAHADADDFLTRGVAWAAADALELTETVNLEGAQLGPWRIAQRIGTGGMGAVYLAERADGEFTKQVAIKVVRQRVASEGVLRRFRAERQILANIEHPNIARLIDAGTTDDGLPYLVMEYVEGEPIDEYCDNHRFTIEKRLQLFRQVCAAVQLAHDKHIVHRDLKPSNVLITPDGTPKLLDFGIAKLLAPELLGRSIEVTAEFQRLMTPAFASPEQIRGETVTPASDVYSLGVILYGLVCGHSPYDESTETSASTEEIVCELEPPPPSRALRQFGHTVGPNGESIALTPESVSTARGTEPDALVALLEAGLDAVVLEALAKKPSERYASADDLAAAIDSYFRHGVAPSSVASPPSNAPARETSGLTGADTADATQSPPTLSEWGHLQVIRRIGKGVFGEVYECRDPSLKLTVALKLFRKRGDADTQVSAEVVQRILKEGQLLARVQHPNVVRVYGAGVHDDTVGLWMEYIDGRNLEELLEVQGRLGAREACLVGIDLCSALAAVHGQGVVHRDIKAHNVIREEGGRIILTDFGSGRDLVGEAPLSGVGAVGTPLYMAPEVLRGGVATARSDIYSLGVLLFRLVTGVFPVDVESWPELIREHERGETKLIRDLRPELRPRVAQVIDTALSMEPEQRFASVGQMQRALEAAADMSADHQALASGEIAVSSGVEQDRRSVRRMVQVLTWLVGGITSVLFVMFLGFATAQVQRQAMQIPPDFFTVSGFGYLRVGISAVIPILILTIFATFVMATLVVFGRLLLWSFEGRGPTGGLLGRLCSKVRTLERTVGSATPESVASVVSSGGLVAIVAVTVVYVGMWRALIALMEETTAAGADLSALVQPWSAYHTVALSTVVAAMLVACVLASRLSTQAPEQRSVLLMLRGAPIAAITIAFVLMAAPWRTLHDSYQPAIYQPAPEGSDHDSDDHRWLDGGGERIDLNGERAFIIATNERESWLYFPELRRSSRVGSGFVSEVGPPDRIFRQEGNQ